MTKKNKMLKIDFLSATTLCISKPLYVTLYGVNDIPSIKWTLWLITHLFPKAH